MKEAVSETLGLDLNYYAMVDMQGFSSLIDAMGGIRLDISKPIPIGGVSTKISGYIEPGEDVLLDGYHALWFARSRAESSDYERMVRQKCVMSAMVRQLDPVTVATRFVELSEAGSNILRTDVPRAEVMSLAELALKAKDQKIASVNFAPPLITSANPDFDLIRSTVKEKIEASETLDKSRPKPKPKATKSASASPAGPESSSSSKSAEPRRSASAEPAADPSRNGGDPDAPYTQTEDLDAVCSVSG
nr:LCP family protein [Tessaracoccus coleopterorum]